MTELEKKMLSVLRKIRAEAASFASGQCSVAGLERRLVNIEQTVKATEQMIRRLYPTKSGPVKTYGKQAFTPEVPGRTEAEIEAGAKTERDHAD